MTFPYYSFIYLNQFFCACELSRPFLMFKRKTPFRIRNTFLRAKRYVILLGAHWLWSNVSYESMVNRFCMVLKSDATSVSQRNLFLEFVSSSSIFESCKNWLVREKYLQTRLLFIASEQSLGLLNFVINMFYCLYFAVTSCLKSGFTHGAM